MAVLQQLGRRPLEDHVAAMLSRAEAEVDDVVCGSDRLFVVLDDDHGVSQIAEPRERLQERAVVALVQPDRRLVEDVEHAGQVRADLRREPDALPLATRQRRGASAQREITNADVVEKPQTVADFAEDPAGDERLAIRQLQLLEHAQRFGARRA